MDEDLLRVAKLGGSREERMWLTTADYLSTLSPELEDAAYRAAVVHWFDEKILDAILGAGNLSRLRPPTERTNAPDTAELYRQLQSFPFVEEYAGQGHNFHSLTRKTVLDHLWQEERDFYREVSARAATHFGHGLDEGEGVAIENLIERAYHLLAADESEGVAFTSWLLLQVSGFGYVDIVHALLEAVQEQVDAGRVSEEVRWRLTVWRAQVDTETARNKNVIRMAADLKAVGDETVPRWVQGEMARFASQSLTDLGRFDEAYRWLQRARDYEDPGSPDEAASNLIQLGRLYHSWIRHPEAEIAYLDALDRYVPSLLLPLRRVELDPEDASEGEPPVFWMVASGEEAEDAVLPPRIEAHYPEAWSKDKDNTYYVAVGDPGDDEDGAWATMASVWPVDADSVLAELWLRLASLYEDMDDYPRADAFGRLGSSIATDVGDENLAAQGAQLLYRLGAKAGDPKLGRAVIKSQKELLESARKRGDKIAQATALSNLAAAYADMLDFEAARESLIEALQLAQEIGDLLAQVDALDGLAGLDWTQGRDADAASRFEQAFELLRERGFLDHQARLLVRIASFNLSRHRPDEARKHYEEALSRYRELGLPSGEFDALRGLGVVAENRLQYDQAARHYEEAISVARRISSRSLEADGLALLAFLQSFRGDHQSARENYQKAVDLARSVGDRVKEADLLLGLGDINRDEDLLDEALETYRQGRQIYAGLKRPDGELSALFGIMFVHTRRGHAKRAVRTADTILSLAHQVGDRNQEVRAHREAALAYSDASQPDRATELIEEAIRLDPQDPELLGALSWILVVAGEYERALRVSEQALAADPTLAWVICNRALALLGLGRPDEALAAYRLAVEVRPEGQQFDNDIKALKRFLKEHPAVHQGEAALRLLEEEQAVLTSKANSRS